MSNTKDSKPLVDREINSIYKKQLERQRQAEEKITKLMTDSTIAKAPTLDQLVADGLAIIGSELSRYRGKTAKGIMLDTKEARTVTSYIEALTKMAREARESSKPELLREMTDEQLLELVQSSIAAKTNKPT